jgi:hypothetical protein
MYVPNYNTGRHHSHRPYNDIYRVSQGVAAPVVMVRPPFSLFNLTLCSFRICFSNQAIMALVIMASTINTRLAHVFVASSGSHLIMECATSPIGVHGGSWVIHADPATLTLGQALKSTEKDGPFTEYEHSSAHDQSMHFTNHDDYHSLTT